MEEKRDDERKRRIAAAMMTHTNTYEYMCMYVCMYVYPRERKSKGTVKSAREKKTTEALTEREEREKP